MKIQPITQNQYAAFHGLLTDYYRDGEDAQTSQEKLDAFIELLFDLCQKGTISGCIAYEKTAVGFVLWGMDTVGFPFSQKPGFGTILEIGVIAAVRGTGLGRRLVEYAETAMTCEKYYVCAYGPAEMFWKKCGYHDSGSIGENGLKMFEKHCAERRGAMQYNLIAQRSPIDKGWSGDRKYCAVTADGKKYLLRISSIDRLERKRREYERMCEVAQLGIPMCTPVEFGTCEEGVYSIQSWIDGEDAQTAIMSMDEKAQYRYGLDAGRILSRIHTVPAPADIPDWENRFNAKIDRKIAMYENCALKYENGQLFLNYLVANRHLLAGRPQSYQHGDYHIGNMMIDQNGILTIIDFDRDDFGDPWEEFNRIVWCAQAAPAFASGMVDGYFDGEVPLAFWRLLALYISSNTLSSLPWAISYGEQEIRVMRNQAAQILRWYDGMKNVVPAWYRKEKT